MGDRVRPGDDWLVRGVALVLGLALFGIGVYLGVRGLFGTSPCAAPGGADAPVCAVAVRGGNGADLTAFRAAETKDNAVEVLSGMAFLVSAGSVPLAARKP